MLVVGGGPAGRALAGACAAAGLATTLLDPAPDRPWPATYGCWAAELPPGLPAHVVAARAAGTAVAGGVHRVGWEYAVLDVPALRAHLDAGLAGVEIRAGRAAGLAGPGRVALAGGGEIAAAVIVDAAGRGRPLAGRPGQGGAAEQPRRGPVAGWRGRGVDAGRPGRGVPAEQTAYGVVVDAATAAPLVPPGEALFMDWRADHGEPGWPTFLYGVPLGGDRVLLEETSLARRPGLPLAVLRRRLAARLAHHGVAVPPDAVTEKVSFPVDTPRHRAPGVLGFGAAAPLVHPATGFSVAAALRLAPAVAAALAAHLPADPDAALAAARATVWPPAARVVHHLRRIGLEAMLRMPPERVPDFFAVFFALPERRRWSYLTGRDDLAGTARTMGALFAAAGWELRARLVLPALLPPARPAPDPAPHVVPGIAPNG